MTSVKELRDLALSARRENSSGRRERYFKARDEAFEIITDGVLEKIMNAAKEGRFKYPIYRWTNTSRFKNEEKDDVKDDESKAVDSVESADVETAEDIEAINNIPEATNVVFGSDTDGNNGLHIMTLMQPTGILYQDTLVAKLRDFFNEQINSGDDSQENQLRVFLQRGPKNYRQCAIFVSWDRPQTRPQMRRQVPFTGRVHQQNRDVNGVAPINTQVQNDDDGGQRRHPFKQFPVRGVPPVRGVAPMRGRFFGGRGRGRPSSGPSSN